MRLPVFLSLIIISLALSESSALAWSWRSLLGGQSATVSGQDFSNPFQGKIFMITSGYGAYLDYLQFGSGNTVEWYGYNFDKDLPELRSAATYRVFPQENHLIVYLSNGEHNDYSYKLSSHVLLLQTSGSTDEYCELPQPAFWLDKSGSYSKMSGTNKLKFAKDLLAQIKGEPLPKPPQEAITPNSPAPDTNPVESEIATSTVTPATSSHEVAPVSGDFNGEMTDIDGNNINPFELIISAKGEVSGTPLELLLEGSISIKSTGAHGALRGQAIYGSQTTFSLISKGTGGKAIFTGVVIAETLTGTWQFADANGQIKKSGLFHASKGN